MPASVAALLDTFDGLNLNIDAVGLPLPCLQLGTFFDRLLFVVLSRCWRRHYVRNRHATRLLTP